VECGSSGYPEEMNGKVVVSLCTPLGCVMCLDKTVSAEQTDGRAALKVPELQRKGTINCRSIEHRTYSLAEVMTGARSVSDTRKKLFTPSLTEP